MHPITYNQCPTLFCHFFQWNWTDLNPVSCLKYFVIHSGRSQRIPGWKAGPYHHLTTVIKMSKSRSNYLPLGNYSNHFCHIMLAIRNNSKSILGQYFYQVSSNVARMSHFQDLQFIKQKLMEVEGKSWFNTEVLNCLKLQNGNWLCIHFSIKI